MTNPLSDEALNSTEGFESNADKAPVAEKKAPEAPAIGAEGDEAPEPEPEGEEGSGADTGETGEEGAEKPVKAKNPVEERIKGALKQRDLARQELESERAAKAVIEARLAAIEARIPGAQQPPAQQEKAAPDPSAYEYGSLDDRYIQDMIDFKAEQQITQHLARLDERRQQSELENQVNAEAARLQEAAKDIVVKGATVYDDFEEVVWERGLRAEYPLEKPTFDALLEADNQAEIVYALASDVKEAQRVANMTPAQQAKYVFAKDAEISAKNTASPRAPRAAPPPGQQMRGAGGRFGVQGDTEDLDAFEKEFFAKKR